jgi:polyketide biosynthesis enoyl-CoA hydratase PksH
MNLETLIVRQAPRLLSLTISRPERANSINSTMISELGAALDQAEQSTDCRTVLLQGAPGVFCTGLDFQEATDPTRAVTDDGPRIAGYMGLLKRFTLSPKVIVCAVDGKVIAGGVGLAAASDLVLATGRSEFSLSEALWGLLPCCVLPFLIRRIGFQKAYAMTLTTRPIAAPEALATHLVDEVTENLDDAVRKLTLRLNLLEEETISDLKRYVGKLCPVTPEIETMAVTEITRLVAQPRVQRNIADYLARGTFPWEGKADR